MRKSPFWQTGPARSCHLEARGDVNPLKGCEGMAKETLTDVHDYAALWTLVEKSRPSSLPIGTELGICSLLSGSSFLA